VVAPWSRSTGGTAPSACSATLANGSGSTAASIVPALSPAGIPGNGMLVTNLTEFTGIPCSARTEATRRYRMFFGALIAMVRPRRSASDLIGESGLT
jgi:hypothetical protein